MPSNAHSVEKVDTFTRPIMFLLFSILMYFLLLEIVPSNLFYSSEDNKDFRKKKKTFPSLDPKGQHRNDNTFSEFKNIAGGEKF